MPASPRRQRFVLQDDADIQRLQRHLASHWKVPGIDVRIGGLAALDAQRAQDRFVRLSGACNCLLGETLAALTLVMGCYAAWVSVAGRISMWMVLAATVGALVLGKGIENGWTRVRLMLVLRELRQRLADVAAGRAVAVAPTQSAPAVRYDYALNSREGAVLRQESARRRMAGAGAERLRLNVQHRDDIRHAMAHLLMHWSLPLIDVQAGVAHPRIVQRAQDQLVRSSAGYSWLFAGALGIASFLGGMLYVLWPSDDVLQWKMGGQWAELALVLLASGCAVLLGWLAEVLWVRLRMLRVLWSLSRRMNS